MVAWTGESDGLSNGLSTGILPNQQSNSIRNDWTAVEGPMEVQRKAAEDPTEVQWTSSKQLFLLILLIKIQ